MSQRGAESGGQSTQVADCTEDTECTEETEYAAGCARDTPVPTRSQTPQSDCNLCLLYLTLYLRSHSVSIYTPRCRHTSFPGFVLRFEWRKTRRQRQRGKPVNIRRNLCIPGSGYLLYVFSTLRFLIGRVALHKVT